MCGSQSAQIIYTSASLTFPELKANQLATSPPNPLALPRRQQAPAHHALLSTIKPSKSMVIPQASILGKSTLIPMDAETHKSTSPICARSPGWETTIIYNQNLLFCRPKTVTSQIAGDSRPVDWLISRRQQGGEWRAFWRVALFCRFFPGVPPNSEFPKTLAKPPQKLSFLQRRGEILLSLAKSMDSGSRFRISFDSLSAIATGKGKLRQSARRHFSFFALFGKYLSFSTNFFHFL